MRKKLKFTRAKESKRREKFFFSIKDFEFSTHPYGVGRCSATTFGQKMAEQGEKRDNGRKKFNLDPLSTNEKVGKCVAAPETHKSSLISTMCRDKAA